LAHESEQVDYDSEADQVRSLNYFDDALKKTKTDRNKIAKSGSSRDLKFYDEFCSHLKDCKQAVEASLAHKKNKRTMPHEDEEIIPSEGVIDSGAAKSGKIKNTPKRNFLACNLLFSCSSVAREAAFRLEHASDKTMVDSKRKKKKKRKSGRKPRILELASADEKNPKVNGE
jgi:hypothetical protein